MVAPPRGMVISRWSLLVWADTLFIEVSIWGRAFGRRLSNRRSFAMARLEAGCAQVGEESTCLGAGLDSMSSKVGMVTQRPEQAEQLWRKWASSVSFRHISLITRGAHLHNTVLRLLWGSEVWPPSRRAHGIV